MAQLAKSPRFRSQKWQKSSSGKDEPKPSLDLAAARLVKKKSLKQEPGNKWTCRHFQVWVASSNHTDMAFSCLLAILRVF